MSKQEHNTPGPWSFDLDRGAIVSEYGDIAEVTGWGNADNETIPNGILLAAAPGLLGALRELSEAARGEMKAWGHIGSIRTNRYYDALIQTQVEIEKATP